MKKILFSLALAAIALSAAAQPRGGANNKPDGPRPGGGEQMRAEKVAYITRALKLTEEEAQKFWIVYDELEEQQMELVKAEKKAYKNLQNAAYPKRRDDGTRPEINEDELTKALAEYLSAKQANTDLKVTNIAKFNKILPKEKVAKLFIAEERFRRQQIKNLGERPSEGAGRGGQRGGHGPQGEMPME